MSGEVITWSPELAPLGKCVVAIGVFDGVHRGHQSLLADAAAEAGRLQVRSVAITFDRDPDQVVMPEAAVPQLLTLADKTRLLLESGVDVVLVVPFTPQVASLPAERFLDEVLGTCCTVLTVHVGSDFRFGERAAGEVHTLDAWLRARGARVRAHELVSAAGAPITSTRVRKLVAAGDLAQANLLLGRPTRVAGVVHEGRAQGHDLGFPTANVAPVPFAALPADGVYAGRAILADGRTWPAAISVGLPPTFPEARDYVEAHVIGFEGDLYGQSITLEFIEKLRDQRSFDDLSDLTAAIGADVARARELAARATSGQPPTSAPGQTYNDRDDLPYDIDAFELNPAVAIGHKVAHSLGMDQPLGDALEDGRPVVEDPAALAAAEAAVAGIDPQAAYAQAKGESWVELVGPRRLSGILGNAGFTASLVSAPLQAADIPFAWDPYPPEEMPSFRPYYGVFDRPFSLLVPASRLEEARAVLEASDARTMPRTVAPPPQQVGPPSHPPGVDKSSPLVRVIIWLVLLGIFLSFIISRW